MEDLCPELIEAILRRVPLKSRARLKCVSRTWCHLITGLRQSSPPTTSSGLIIFLKNINNEPNLHESSLVKVQDHYFTLHGSFKHDFPWLIDSCNGLLLYAKNDSGDWTYYISNPVLDQSIALPRRPKSSILARESLAFDGLQHNHFNVICYFFQEEDIAGEKISSQIFSSETGEWREHQAPIMNSYLLLEDGFQRNDCFGPSVYINGRLHWIWSLCMLVYEDEREFFKLVQLPKSKTTRNRKDWSSLRLWASEGKIHYCEPTQEGFHVWLYIDDGCEEDEQWQAKRPIVLDKLNSQTIEIPYEVEYKTWKVRIGGWGLIRPCAFNEDLQVLYLQLPTGTIVSYSFETQELAEVWSYGKPGENYFMSYVYPFLFNSVNLIPRNI